MAGIIPGHFLFPAMSSVTVQASVRRSDQQPELDWQFWQYPHGIESC
jgi:hypothetical protein